MKKNCYEHFVNNLPGKLMEKHLNGYDLFI